MEQEFWLVKHGFEFNNGEWQCWQFTARILNNNVVISVSDDSNLFYKFGRPIAEGAMWNMIRYFDGVTHIGRVATQIALSKLEHEQ